MGISLEAIDEFLEDSQSPSQLPGLFNLMHLSGVCSSMPGDAQPLLTMQKMAQRFAEDYTEVVKEGGGELFASDFILALRALLKADQENDKQLLKAEKKSLSKS